MLHGTYKSACRQDPTHRRGTCVALTKVDGAFKLCGQAVTSRGKAAQVCDGCLRAPTIVKADAMNDGIISYHRFCRTCDALRPLEEFRGFLAHCARHRAGHSDGKRPVIPVRIEGEELVAHTWEECATLVAGKTPRSERMSLTKCNIVGCDEGVFASSGFCGDHSKVRLLELCAHCVHNRWPWLLLDGATPA